MNGVEIGLGVDSGFWQRVCALYLPLVAALLLTLATPQRKRRFAACLLGFLWTLPTLLALQKLNLRAEWWSFPEGDWRLCGMPLELYAGWAVLWGILPAMAFPQLAIGWVAAWMAGVDLVAMPLMSRAVRLGPRWLVGEALAIGLILLPGLCLARWTERETHLAWRAGLQVATSGLLFLFLTPEIVFALRPGNGWAPLLGMPGWERQIGILILLTLALPGVAAAMEFAQRGMGTPIPYDAPKRLVVSGVYRYVANPMQLSCTLMMVGWACCVRNAWLLVPAGLGVAYSAGVARWDEEQDLEARFGADWRTYRREVRNWVPRVLPYSSGKPALLYLAAGCGPCSELWRWIARREPVGMEIVAAESLPVGTIERMTYDPGDGSATVSGIRAMGRALEHLHLGWAMAGAALRLPRVWQVVQIAIDAGGLGPRQVDGQRRALPQEEMPGP